MIGWSATSHLISIDRRVKYSYTVPSVELSAPKNGNFRVMVIWEDCYISKLTAVFAVSAAGFAGRPMPRRTPPASGEFPDSNAHED